MASVGQLRDDEEFMNQLRGVGRGRHLSRRDDALRLPVCLDLEVVYGEDGSETAPITEDGDKVPVVGVFDPHDGCASDVEGDFSEIALQRVCREDVGAVPKPACADCSAFQMCRGGQGVVVAA